MYDSLIHKPHLATEYADRLHENSRPNTPASLFLWSPQGSGKTTFLKYDFMPEVIIRGWLPVYVELKADCPLQVLVEEAIKTAFLSEWKPRPKIPRLPAWLKADAAHAALINRTNPNDPKQINYMMAFQGLHTLTGKPLVFIIDEAPFTLTDPFGNTMLAALKNVMGTMNTSGKDNKFMLVFTGSDHDALSHMVTDMTQPFYGFSIATFSS
jgi:hypothetical protein